MTERQVIDALGVGEQRASFENMANALPKLGFRAVAYAVSFEQLTQLKIPVVAYLRYRKDEHFTVIRSVSHDIVSLADSSLGHRQFTKAQFLDMWETRDDPVLKGRILAVLPQSTGNVATDDTAATFFQTAPTRRTALPATILKQEASRASIAGHPRRGP